MKKILLILGIIVFLSITAFAVVFRVSIQELFNYSEILVKVYTYEGSCMNNRKCESTFNIYADGAYGYNGQIEGTITQQQFSELLSAITGADYEEIKAQKFIGTCSVAHEEGEVVYTIRNTDNEVHRIASCQVEINIDAEPFKTIRNIQESTEN
jgi:hypothetical protein